MASDPDSASNAHLDNGVTAGNAPSELTTVLDDLLSQLSTKFSAVSAELLAKMDDMSRRLDSLEATIQAGQSGSSADQGK